ncbi:MAG: hypothetical protein J6X32_07395 [Salinivirgaceae bacterium]|nr:hypothetical protein [Salinivirgaceae bacterium]
MLENVKIGVRFAKPIICLRFLRHTELAKATSHLDFSLTKVAGIPFPSKALLVMMWAANVFSAHKKRQTLLPAV